MPAEFAEIELLLMLSEYVERAIDFELKLFINLISNNILRISTNSSGI